MSRILTPGRNSWRVSKVDAAGALVDAQDYYRAFYRAAEQAEHYLLIAGWQFESSVPLLRGADAERLEQPVTLLEFLRWLCERKPELRIYILAWDYSLVFALEREWMQKIRFDWMTCDRIQFKFDAEHAMGGSHHQKFVVVDGAIGFVGGVDLCEGRWDDRSHTLDNPLRLNRDASPQKPYHDVMAYCAGPVVRDLEQLFSERWQRATGDKLELPQTNPSPLEPPTAALPICCREVALSRTFAGETGSGSNIEEIKTLYQDAIRSAQRSIYIETQYLTSRVVHDALVDRMRERPGLEIVAVMNKGGDTPKETFVLGRAQDFVLASLSETARATGNLFRVYYSAQVSPEHGELPTFIHSKVLIIDDRLLSIGSANCTNRSLHVDSELNFVWECAAERDELVTSVRRFRASLLAEHAGVDRVTELESSENLVLILDELARNADSRLRHRPIPESVDAVELRRLRARTFDPDRPLDEYALSDWVAADPDEAAGQPSPSSPSH